MSEHESRHPQIIFYDIIERLMPASSDTAARERNEARVQKLQQEYKRIRNDKSYDLPRDLVVTLIDDIEGDMSEVVAHALRNPRTLHLMAESDQRELMQLALENDISVLEVQAIDRKKLPKSADIFPKPVTQKALPKLVRRQEMLADLIGSTPQPQMLELLKPALLKEPSMHQPSRPSPQRRISQ